MATTNYQNVGTPRFYVDIYSYLQAVGLGGDADPPFSYGLNPTSQGVSVQPPIGSDEDYFEDVAHKVFFKYRLNGQIKTSILQNLTHNKSVIGFLGHNFHSEGLAADLQIEDSTDTDDGSGLEGIVNWSSPYSTIEQDGFSLYKTTFELQHFSSFSIGLDQQNVFSPNFVAKLGSVFLGTYYDMPYSPDLSLKMSIEMDGIKNLKTKGGASLTGINYTKPQNWGDAGAWQLGGASNLRAGRRVWNLSFSYLSDSDVFPVNATTSNPSNDYPDDDTLLNGTDFFSQVWNRTMGGHLPFIFQPDKDNSNPDQFAICRFDMKSLQITQTLGNVYSVNLKIRETW